MIDDHRIWLTYQYKDSLLALHFDQTNDNTNYSSSSNIEELIKTIFIEVSPSHQRT